MHGQPRQLPKALISTLFGAGLLLGQWPAISAPLTTVTVRNVVGGAGLTINNAPAGVNAQASVGQLVATAGNRAEVLFDRRAIGLLGKNTEISLAENCVKLNKGTLLINGNQKVCVGANVVVAKGTTFVVSKLENETYDVSVLNGEAEYGSAGELSVDRDLDILSLYPRVNPSLSVQGGGFASVYPSGGGAFTGGLTYFTPLSQSSANRILYSSTSLGSSFQNLWGVSTEVGYRWFGAGSQSTSGAYVGYSGYGSPGCFSNLVNAGLQWERSRWRVGGSGGWKVNNCPTGLSYGSLNLSIPVASVKTQPLYLSISPYFLSGNVVGSSLLTATDNSVFPGVRATVEVPVSESFSLRAYAGGDTVFGVTVGGYFTYRIPTAGKLYNDPNAPVPIVATSGANTVSKAAPASFDPVAKTTTELAKLALAGQNQTVSNVQQSLGLDAGAQAQAGTARVIPEGQRGLFSANGDLISVAPISNTDFLSLLTTNLRGQNPLPESRQIARQAKVRGVFNTRLAGLLGTDYLNNASLAVSNTVDTPFSPITQIPVGKYVCAATAKARSYGAAEAQKGQFTYSGQSAYFGKGSLTSQGYPATDNKSDAYVFSDPGVCNEINRLANQGYDVVYAEAI